MGTFKMPTQEDIKRLGENELYVHHAIMAGKAHGWSWEQQLMVMVRALVIERSRLIDELVKADLRVPRIYVLPDGSKLAPKEQTDAQEDEAT